MDRITSNLAIAELSKGTIIIYDCDSPDNVLCVIDSEKEE